MLNNRIKINDLQEICRNTMVEHLGIEFLEIGDDYIRARMPVDHRTIQPHLLLHGGASVAMAESLGSIGSHLIIDQAKQVCVGMEINANHIRPVAAGWVYARAKPVHIGKKSHIWEIRINNEHEQLVCISRLTMAVLDKQPE